MLEVNEYFEGGVKSISFQGPERVVGRACARARARLGARISSPLDPGRGAA